MEYLWTIMGWSWDWMGGLWNIPSGKQTLQFKIHYKLRFWAGKMIYIKWYIWLCMGVLPMPCLITRGHPCCHVRCDLGLPYFQANSTEDDGTRIHFWGFSDVTRILESGINGLMRLLIGFTFGGLVRNVRISPIETSVFISRGRELINSMIIEFAFWIWKVTFRYRSNGRFIAEIHERNLRFFLGL